MKEEDLNEENSHEDEIIFTSELDREAFNVIIRLYDKTFRDLVDR